MSDGDSEALPIFFMPRRSSRRSQPFRVVRMEEITWVSAEARRRELRGHPRFA
jgi:hypothetical protein